jgi:hypothetical protein
MPMSRAVLSPSAGHHLGQRDERGRGAQLLVDKLGDVAGDAARQLVQALECISLAIIQAASYIDRLRPRMSASKYLRELHTLGTKVGLLHKAAPDMRRDEQASNSVFKTWQISFDYIREKRSSAADLLSFMSFFNPQGIPSS